MIVGRGFPKLYFDRGFQDLLGFSNAYFDITFSISVSSSGWVEKMRKCIINNSYQCIHVTNKIVFCLLIHFCFQDARISEVFL